MDAIKNAEMRKMFNYYRNNLSGEPPAGSGDDLYNDRIDNIKIDDTDLTKMGTDEAGNPIMANPLNVVNASSDQPSQGGILSNVVDWMAESGERMLLNEDGTMRPVGDIAIDAAKSNPMGKVITDTAGYLYRFATGTPEEQKQLAIPVLAKNRAKDFIHGMNNATELEHTKLYENFFYNAEKKNEEIKRISGLLGFDVSSYANDRDLWIKMALAADRVERMGKFRKYQDAEGNIDMARIYADFPGLAEAQRKYGTAAAAMALANVEGMQTINDVYDNAFTRFFGSIYTGGQRSVYSLGKSWEWGKAMMGGRRPSREEQVAIDEYDAALKNLPRYNYNSVTGTMGAMLGGAAENGMLMLLSRIPHVINAVAAKGRFVKAAEVAGMGIMAAMIAPQQYEELVTRTDEKGRPVYTPEQARTIAIAQAVPQAVLEDYSLRQISGAIFGKSAAPALGEIIKKNAGLEAMKAGVKDYASLKIRESIKSGAISLGAEAAEEFEQAFSDRIVENVAQVIINGKDADVKSLDDILKESTGEMLEALSAIGGFGLIGFLGHPIANTRAVLGFRSHVQQVVHNNVLQGRIANIHYGEVLSGIWQNRKNIKELQDKAPEVVKTILDAQNKIAGMEYGFVDVKTLYQQEGGPELVQQIAEKAGVSAEELAVCMDGTGMLQVKTAALMQMDIPENQQKAVQDNVTASLDAVTEMQYKEVLEIAKGQEESLKNFNDETYKKGVDNIIAARCQDAEQAKLAREIIEANYENPQAEFKRRLDAVNAEIMEEIDPVLRELKSGMKQGTTLVRDAEGNATGVRVSNNDWWYSNYYKDYGRAPSKEWLVDNAIRIASGRQDPRYGLPDYQNNTDESREYYAGVADKLDKLVEQRDALNAIKDRMQELKAGGIAATATLSPEGLQVYDAAIRLMGTSNNKDVQKVGRYNALFVARYADRMAKVYSRVKQKPYTAIDYVRDYLKIDVNAMEGQIREAAQYNQEGLYTGLFEILPKNIQDEKKAEGKALADKLSVIREDKNLPESKKRIKDRDEIFITHSPDIYKELGFGELDFVIVAKDLEGVSKSAANQIGKHAPHEIYRDILKKLPMRLCSPIVVMDSVTIPGRVTILVDIDVKDDKGNPAKLFIPVEFNKQGFSKKINLAVSLHGRNESQIDNTLLEIQNKNTPKNPGAKIYYVNENKSTASKAMARVQFPATLLEYSASIRSTIAQKYGFVNYEKWADKNRKKYNQKTMLYQMAGQKALTANQENLQRAMAMWEEAKSQEEIFKKTGWVHGVDGKWRFEIPDLFNNIDPDALEIPENKMMGASVKLSDVYNNPQLYEAYPWLRNIDVVVAYPEALMLFS
ncbi:MAG: hypothetical protein IJ657_03960, partial [Acidaminococcaceae bacterium]|nr:hypothetical protein [Acidaminococcaceae bacterium]